MHHDRQAARTAEAAVLYHANQLDAQAATRPVGEIDSPMTAVVLALARAALWGTGDFFGGLSTRRLNVLIVLFWSQLVGLLGVVGLDRRQRRRAAGCRAAVARQRAGLAGAVGLGCLYRGMAVGAMGIVAPISATSPIVPLAVSVVARRRADGGAVGGDRARARRDRARLA